MKMITLIMAGIFIVFTAFKMKKQDNSLYDTKWLLKTIHSSAGTQEVSTKAFIKFNKEKNSAGGNGSCNSFGSNFSIDGKKMNFTNVFSTKMYCEAVQGTEDSFFRQLGKVTTYKIKNKSLLLYHDKDLVLEFAME